MKCGRMHLYFRPLQRCRRMAGFAPRSPCVNVKKPFTAELVAIGLAAGLLAGGARAGQDDDFLAAREAFQKGNIARLESLAIGLADHPLYPYVAYWQLRSRLAETPESVVQGFLSQHRDALVAQRLRADWLKWLGERGQWADFEREYPQLAADDV